MEEGFRIDVQTLMDLKRSYESILFSLKKEIEGKSGEAVRLNSNRDLGTCSFTIFVCLR